mmetsp:Transcript_81056/g.230113  ORF Transcript_81056/g.230113 Transcript_81056/m.230113 type:complete len:262 (-) Transcript_81056:85-870(-)
MAGPSFIAPSAPPSWSTNVPLSLVWFAGLVRSSPTSPSPPSSATAADPSSPPSPPPTLAADSPSVLELAASAAAASAATASPTASSATASSAVEAPSEPTAAAPIVSLAALSLDLCLTEAPLPSVPDVCSTAANAGGQGDASAGDSTVAAVAFEAPALDAALDAAAALRSCSRIARRVSSPSACCNEDADVSTVLSRAVQSRAPSPAPSPSSERLDLLALLATPFALATEAIPLEPGVSVCHGCQGVRMSCTSFTTLVVQC